MNDSGKIPDTTINSIGMELVLIPSVLVWNLF